MAEAKSLLEKEEKEVEGAIREIVEVEVSISNFPLNIFCMMMPRID